MRCPSGRISIGFVVGLSYQRSAVRSARRVSALQAASVHQRAFSRAGRCCATAPRRCPKAAGTRSRGCSVDGGAHRRRRGELRELDAAQGHPPRDAQRHAGRGGGVRRGASGDMSAASLQPLQGAGGRQRDQDRALPGAQRAPGVQQRASTRDRCSPAWRWSPAAGSIEDLHGEPGHTRLEQLDDYYGIDKRDILTGSNAVPPDRKMIFDKVTNVHYSGTQHDEDQPVHLLVHTEVCHTICGDEYGHPCVRFCPGERLRDGGRRPGRAAAADQRVELRPLQDLRHHGSRTA